MRTGSQSLKIFAVALVLCSLWTIARSRLPKPELGETNYTANRLRIERFLETPAPRCLIVGTSIAGRLLPSYFEGSNFENIVNLGLDGASPITGLQLALGKTNPPAVVLLEAHRLKNPTSANDDQLLAISQGMDQHFHQHVTLTKAESRPTTVLYSYLKSRQGAGRAQAAADGQKNNVTEISKPSEKPKELVGTIQALQARGSKVVLLRLPVGRENPADPKAEDDIDLSAQQLGLPIIDLYRQSIGWENPVSYSDGLHLAPESARRLAKTLAEHLAR
ncbi:MAG: hypothetical protein ACO3E8_01880 [Candidatus Methylacidiphilales bacterium]